MLTLLILKWAKKLGITVWFEFTALVVSVEKLSVLSLSSHAVVSG